MRRLFGVIVVIVALSGCNTREIFLRDEIDALRNQVATSKQVTATLQEIGVMIDSVDILRSDLARGAYNDNPDRLREINKYLETMQLRTAKLQHELDKGKGVEPVYAEMVARLQRDLTAKTLEFDALAKELFLDKAANDTLRDLVDAQNVHMQENTVLLVATQEEVLQLDQEVKRLTVDASSAGSYHEQALALEKASERIRLAIEKSKGL